MAQKLSRQGLIASIIGVIVVVAVVAVLIITTSNNSSDSSEPTFTQAPGTASSAPQAEETNTPGARLDSEQRSWPDPSGYFDDTSLSTPGTTSVDPLYKRPAHVPINHDGDLPDSEDLVNSMDTCSQKPVVLTGKTQQQYVNARFLAVNDQAGPTTMINDVPGGYAHSPQGAIMAALNQLGYGLYGVGDEVGYEIDKKLWSTSAKAQSEIPDPSKRSQSSRDYSRAPQLSISWGYKVITCSPDVMVIEDLMLAPEELPDSRSEGNMSSTVTLQWKDNDWVPNFTGNADAGIARTKTVPDESVDDYTEVALS